MKAKEAISITAHRELPASVPTVSSEAPLLDVLQSFLESPDELLRVTDGAETVGVIDSRSLLEALGRQIPGRPDCSVIQLECAPADYSASAIARAVEDADVHLVDLLSAPGLEGKISVTLRIRCDNPEGVIHSLERYGYTVTDGCSRSDSQPSVAWERLLELQTLINV